MATLTKRNQHNITRYGIPITTTKPKENKMTTIYDLSIDQTVDLIRAVGDKRTVLVEGHMGTGKTSILKVLADKFPNHMPMYFDATTKDLGDLFVPNLLGDAAKQSDCVTFTPNEEFGIHLGKPVVLMIDEFGKANPMVKQGLTRVLLERMIGSRTLPEGSIVFATTNLGAENVGDMLVAHQRNRLTIVKMRKPDVREWLAWAFNNSIDHVLMGWVKDNPAVLNTFDECKAEDNPYIFHPADPSRVSFVTPRSLESASDLMRCREGIDDTTLTGALMGTIGKRAALDMMSYLRLADHIPPLEEIKTRPATAKIPESPSAVCMVVFRTLVNIDAEWVENWMTYLERLDPEAQAMFANGVRAKGYNKQAVVMRSKAFKDWAIKNKHLYTADV